MTYTCFDVSVENHIGHIKLNRPEKRNSMIMEFWDELPVAVRELDSTGDVRVIVISSTGPHFSSGIDVAAFAGSVTGETSHTDNQAHRDAVKGLAFYENVQKMQDSFTALAEARVPVIAAIQGGCIGGAVDLTTACDMRYMTEDAFMTVYEINIGMTADVGTFPRITNILPDGLVRELCFTGRRMLADECKSTGFVNAVFEDQKSLLEGVMAIAAEIATKAPLAIRGTKQIINYALDHTTRDTLDYISIWNASNLQQSEIMEAMGANMRKEQGNFAPLPPQRSTLTE